MQRGLYIVWNADDYDAKNAKSYYTLKYHNV